MKRMGYFAGVVAVAVVSLTVYVPSAVFAGSDCCAAKQTAAAENAETKCLTCEKAISDKCKAVKVEHEGKTFYFCCECCAEKFKKDPSACKKDK